MRPLARPQDTAGKAIVVNGTRRHRWTFAFLPPGEMMEHEPERMGCFRRSSRVLFFFTSRRAAQQMVSALTARIPGEPASAFGLGSPVGEIERLLESDDSPPMHRDLPGRVIDIFISGHTHAPAISNHPGRQPTGTVIVYSGCWLRQLRPVAAHFGGPPVFTSRFVQTHVRLFLDADRMRVELWEHPKPAPGHPRLAERLAIAGRQPQQPDHGATPRVIDSREIPIVPVA